MARTILSMIAASTLFIASPANAQEAPPCAPRAGIMEKLEVEFNEKLEAIGVTYPGSLVEILTSKDGTWTMLLTNGNGLSCIVMTGDGWLSVPPNHAKVSGS